MEDRQAKRLRADPEAAAAAPAAGGAPPAKEPIRVSAQKFNYVKVRRHTVEHALGSMRERSVCVFAVLLPHLGIPAIRVGLQAVGQTHRQPYTAPHMF